MLIRVFEIPPPTGNFHFSGGERQSFVEVDWFRSDGGHPVDMSKQEGRDLVEENVRQKRYFKPDRAYLVLHPVHSFTINYRAD